VHSCIPQRAHKTLQSIRAMPSHQRFDGMSVSNPARALVAGVECALTSMPSSSSMSNFSFFRVLSVTLTTPMAWVCACVGSVVDCVSRPLQRELWPPCNIPPFLTTFRLIRSESEGAYYTTENPPQGHLWYCGVVMSGEDAPRP
jgi:hypothetical protein